MFCVNKAFFFNLMCFFRLCLRMGVVLGELNEEKVLRTGEVYFSMPAQYGYIHVPSMERFSSSETDPELAYKGHLELKREAPWLFKN